MILLLTKRKKHKTARQKTTIKKRVRFLQWPAMFGYRFCFLYLSRDHISKYNLTLFKHIFIKGKLLLGARAFSRPSKACFIRRISAESNSIQLSVAEMRLLIQTSHLCRTYFRIEAIASWIHSYFDNVITKFMINNRTDA